MVRCWASRADDLGSIVSVGSYIQSRSRLLSPPEGGGGGGGGGEWHGAVSPMRTSF